MPKVYNKNHGNAPADAVYVGRPSIYGNPFTMDGEPTRSRVIKSYMDWVTTQPTTLMAIRQNLPGKDLVCWCAPKQCHADFILRIANDYMQFIVEWGSFQRLIRAILNETKKPYNQSVARMACAGDGMGGPCNNQPPYCRACELRRMLELALRID